MKEGDHGYLCFHSVYLEKALLQDPMAGSRDDIMELLRLTIDDQEVLQDIAEKLVSNEFTVPTLLNLEDSDLQNIVDHELSAASLGAKLGFKAAIQARKKTLTHGLPSRRPFSEDGKILRELAEFLAEKRAKRQSKKSVALSSVKASLWCIWRLEFQEDY
ncbi:unnamed protein product [Calypogeia fissa]